MNTNNLEKVIIQALLDKTAEYPPELLAPRRAGFITQITIAQLKHHPLFQQEMAGRKPNGDVRGASPFSR